MTASLPSSPHIAIVRFSALGDVVMAAAAVRALLQALPDTRLTWVTSPLGHAMLEGMAGVNFLVTDKPRSLSDYRALYRLLGARRFDAVLAMQANLRINLLYPALRAPLKIGFDRTRARELQWLFCNRRIPFNNDHLVDSFLSFVTELTGAPASAEWALPLTHAEQAWAKGKIAALPRPLIAILP